MHRPKILYIVGFARSGSTLLGDILGEIDGVFHAGEVAHTWKSRALAKSDVPNRHRCGCGMHFTECKEVWGQAWPHLQDALAARTGMDPDDVSADVFDYVVGQWREQARRQYLDWRIFHRLEPPASEEARAYGDLIMEVYRQVARATGADIVVDSTKDRAIASFLASLPHVDVSFVHLVRDPRGVVYSRQKKLRVTSADGMTDLHRLYLAKDALLWTKENLEAHLLRRQFGERSLFVRYEDFAREPYSIIQGIASFMNKMSADLPFVDERTVELGASHAIGGNRNRFKVGSVVISKDSRWEKNMRLFDKRIVSLISYPVFRYYDYKMV